MRRGRKWRISHFVRNKYFPQWRDFDGTFRSKINACKFDNSNEQWKYLFGCCSPRLEPDPGIFMYTVNSISNCKERSKFSKHITVIWIAEKRKSWGCIHIICSTSTPFRSLHLWFKVLETSNQKFSNDTVARLATDERLVLPLFLNEVSTKNVHGN